MAVLALTDARVEINSVNMSQYISEVTLEFAADEQEDTAFGDTWRSRIAGLKDGSVQLKFNQDFANSTVDSVIWALFGTVVTLKVRPTSSAIGTSNPEYQTSVLISEWNPLGNAVGELATVEVTWPLAASVTRATA